MDEHASRVDSKAWKMELRGVARSVIAEIGFAVGPAATPPGPQKHDRACGNATVALLEVAHVLHGETIVGVAIGLRRDVDDNGRRHQPLERNAVDRYSRAGEMNGRVNVSSAVLRSGKRIRRVK